MHEDRLTNRVVDARPPGGQVRGDDITMLRAYLALPSFQYVDQAFEAAHETALARWPLLRELAGQEESVDAVQILSPVVAA